MTLALITPTPEHAEFLQLFNRLCVALRDAGDDSGVTQGIYFDALRDLPFAALEAGAAALMKEPGRRFFPTTAEWRTASEKAQHAQLREAVKPGRDEPWRLECERCEDTGFVVAMDCPGDATCGRTRTHAAHPFTRPCFCRPTNRTWQRHQKFGAGE